MSNSLEIIHRFHAALAAGDRETAFALIDPHATWYSDKIDAPWSGTHQGIEAIKQHFANAGKHIQANNAAGKKFINQKFISDGELVIELGQLDIKFINNDSAYTDDYVCVYTINNDKIISFKVFEDSLALYRAFHSSQLG